MTTRTPRRRSSAQCSRSTKLHCCVGSPPMRRQPWEQTAMPSSLRMLPPCRQSAPLGFYAELWLWLWAMLLLSSSVRKLVCGIRRNNDPSPASFQVHPATSVDRHQRGRGAWRGCEGCFAVQAALRARGQAVARHCRAPLAACAVLQDDRRARWCGATPYRILIAY